jgi:hypothetical protein
MQMSEFEDGYRLISGRSQDRNLSGGLLHHIAPVHQGTRATETGMAQRLARGAHNSEVTRSKRVAGISSFSSFTETTRHSASDVKLEQPHPL